MNKLSLVIYPVLLLSSFAFADSQTINLRASVPGECTIDIPDSQKALLERDLIAVPGNRVAADVYFSCNGNPRAMVKIESTKGGMTTDKNPDVYLNYTAGLRFFGVINALAITTKDGDRRAKENHGNISYDYLVPPAKFVRLDLYLEYPHERPKVRGTYTDTLTIEVTGL